MICKYKNKIKGTQRVVKIGERRPQPALVDVVLPEVSKIQEPAVEYEIFKQPVKEETFLSDIPGKREEVVRKKNN